MRVKMLKTAKGPEIDAPAGCEIVLNDDLAKIFIDRGYAVSLEASTAETAVDETPVETTVVAPAETAAKKAPAAKKKAK